jgi:DTW domain-containing protein YfiP
MNTRLHIVVIQHSLELKERSNTARHALALLKNAEQRLYGVKDVPLKLDDLSNAWLLWPDAPQKPVGAPSTLVVLDGSWSQTKRMVQRISEVRNLPRYSVTPKPGRRSLREAPEGGMSTLEALAEALRELESPEAGARLASLHEELISQQLRDRGYVGKTPSR